MEITASSFRLRANAAEGRKAVSYQQFPRLPSHAGLFAGVLFALAALPASALHVGEFGAVPDDGKDDARAIQSAINAAIERGDSLVEFGPGVYEVTELPPPEQEQFKNVVLLIEGAEKGLTLRGALAPNWTPATQLVHMQPGPEDNFKLGYLIFVKGGRDVMLQNLTIDFPGAIVSGPIVGQDETSTTIEVFEGLLMPVKAWENSHCYPYDAETGIVEELVTKGTVTPLEGRRLKVNAKVGHVGGHLAISTQRHIANQRIFSANLVDGLTFDNLVTVSGIGHCY